MMETSQSPGYKTDFPETEGARVSSWYALLQKQITGWTSDREITATA